MKTWKQGFIGVLVIFTLLLTFTACDNGNGKDNDTYYVKYETSMTSIYIIKKSYIKISTENGIKNIETSPAFSETFGPVSKGFLASLETYLDVSSSLVQTSVTARIYISKNSEPFVLKAFDTSACPMSNNPIKINYKIDF